MTALFAAAAAMLLLARRGPVAGPVGPGDLAMSFAWPWVLLSLLVVPVLLAVYIVMRPAAAPASGRVLERRADQGGAAGPLGLAPPRAVRPGARSAGLPRPGERRDPSEGGRAGVRRRR